MRCGSNQLRVASLPLRKATPALASKVASIASVPRMSTGPLSDITAWPTLPIFDDRIRNASRSPHENCTGSGRCALAAVATDINNANRPTHSRFRIRITEEVTTNHYRSRQQATIARWEYSVWNDAFRV